MNQVLQIVQDATLTYHQKVLALARLAEANDHESLPVNDAYVKAKEMGIICDLNEGNTPYRPRYIIPDYRILMQKGCAMLELEAPKDLWEATAALLMMYHHVPSITSFPVFLGNFDELLEPFVLKVSKEEAKKCLRLFLAHIDKTLTDSFVHADLGPKASVTGELILELTEEMNLAMPNLSLKYDPEITPDDFAEKAVSCMLKTSKPSFANHRMFVKEWGEDYAIASCYNGLKIAGGGFTLHRLRLATMAKQAESVEDFFARVLPNYTDLLLNGMEDRIRFIVEQSKWFETDFLAREGFVKMENFTGMFGLVGLAEAVNTLLKIEDPAKGFGYNSEADQLGVRIMEALNDQVNGFKSKYCACTEHHYGLHAQVGIDSDGMDNSPGARIPIGYEPALHQQLNHSTLYHKYFVTGCGDVFKFDQTWFNSTQALLDIIRGAMAKGYRYFSGYNADADVVRVTGYLVKRSEIEKLDANQTSLNNATVFGKGARDGGHALDRRIHDQSSR